MKSGELGHGELLGAGVGTEILRDKGFTDAIGFGERAQIINQCFALLRETQFHKIQKARFGGARWVCLSAWSWRSAGGEGEFCAFSGQAEGDESGGDFRRRIERSARNLENELGARVELGDDGKIAVVARAGLGGQAKRNFGLNDDVDLVDEVSEIEQVMKDRRCDVVRKIAVDADAAAGSDGGDVRFENVAADDVEVGELFCEMVEARQERRIEFDGVDGSAGGEKVLGHFTVPRTDFDPTVSVVPRKRHGGMRRNANGASDFFAPVEISEEVLAEALASHGWNSVASGAQSAARVSEVRR